MTFTIDPESRATHADLSSLGVPFLELMASLEELPPVEKFAWLEDLGVQIGYTFQYWPVFIDRKKVRSIGELNAELCSLVRSVPRRVFGLAPAKLEAFYGLVPAHAKLVAVALANPRWVDNTLARTDFLLTTEGFRCLEINMAGNIGGLHCDIWGPQLLAQEVFRPFVEKYGDKLRPSPLTSSLQRFLLRQALGRYRLPEIHLRILLADAFFNGEIPMKEMLPEICENFANILEPLGGKVGGSMELCANDDLVLRDDGLYHGDQRVVGVVEGRGSLGSGDEIYGAWLRGKIDLYNGPATPVLSDKQNLALLSELAESSLFDDDERRLIASLVPWTRRVSTVSVHPEGQVVERSELVECQQERLLKTGGGYGGYDIVFGPSLSPQEWDQAIDTAYEQGGWVAQEILEPRPMMMCLGRQAMAHDVVWAFLLNGNSYGGAMVRGKPRSGRPEVINSAQGARMAAVFEVEEGARE